MIVEALAGSFSPAGGRASVFGGLGGLTTTNALSAFVSAVSEGGEDGEEQPCAVRAMRRARAIVPRPPIQAGGPSVRLERGSNRRETEFADVDGQQFTAIGAHGVAQGLEVHGSL